VRVLLQSRAETFYRAGGEAEQIRQLAAALRAAGVEAHASAEISPALDGVDLVHLFGIMQPAETLAQAQHAARHRTPVVLTPIYQDLRAYHTANGNGTGYESVRPWARLALQALSREPIARDAWCAHWRARGRSLREQQQEILRRADVLLANSELEGETLLREFCGGWTSHLRVSVLRLGVAPEFFTATPERFAARWGTQLNGAVAGRALVVCAGFLTALKNQLALLEALRGTGLILVLAGAEVPTHRGYARRLRAAAGRSDPRVVLTGALPREELASLFAATRVVVQPSWFESAGMACLEAAAAGANVVITSCGFAREYFGDAAWYCQPDSPESIRAAVLAAWAAPPQKELSARIRREFDWDAAARAAIATYEEVLRRTGKR
jgi:glycosyltransferase involved in cell wall biosynthesis